MNPKLVLLPTLTSVVIILAGCQSGPPQTNSHTTASPEASAPASTPVTHVAAPSVASTAMASPIRIKAGAGALKDAVGVEWLGDTGFGGGDVIERPELTIANTKQPEVYRSEHYSMDSFCYHLPNGSYQVKLHFCETYEGITGPGERVFSFDVEGKAYKDFDVWTKSGGFARAYVETVDVLVADGKLDIRFIPSIENPQVNGIEIIPVQ